MSLGVIDDLELQIARLTVELKRPGADHRYIPLLVTAPGFGWINAFTVASEIGDIERFASPTKLADLAAAPALAAPHEQRSAARVEICLAEGERFVDAQPGAPQE